GIHSACKRYKVDLVGGDTTSSGKGLVISVTALGEATEEELVYRDGAKEGDLICVSGNLGGAYLGLQILEREKQLWIDNPQIKPDLENKQYIIGRQLKPEARFDIIEDMRKFEVKPTSMIDVSDGLSSDLLHLCHKSDVGALIEEEQVPIHEESYNMALKFTIDPINTALNGGEDYELLFTVPAENKELITGLLDVSIIGVITEASKGVKMHTKGNNTHELVAGGWNHLRPQNTLKD
ncbi:MAG: thiamine-monophosphate kinase, partial [Limisphaerales bacterium]